MGDGSALFGLTDWDACAEAVGASDVTKVMCARLDDPLLRLAIDGDEAELRTEAEVPLEELTTGVSETTNTVVLSTSRQ